MANQIEVTSKQFWLNSKDFLRGMLLAILTAGFMALQTALDTGEIHWKAVIMGGISGGVAYLLKNFLQPAQIKQTVSNDEIEKLRGGETAPK